MYKRTSPPSGSEVGEEVGALAGSLEGSVVVPLVSSFSAVPHATEKAKRERNKGFMLFAPMV
jgi:hypothetical protein